MVKTHLATIPTICRGGDDAGPIGVRDQFRYDYAVIRVVPKVEREEFINAGVILSCPDRSFLEASIKLNEARLLALDPSLDLEMVKTHLATIPTICRGGDDAGPIGQLSQRDR